MSDNRRIRRFAELTIRHKWISMGLTAAVIAAAAGGLGNIGFDTSYRIWFQEGRPTLVDYDTLLNRFGSDDSAVIVFRDADKSFVRNAPLTKIRELTDALWKVNGVKRVDSLANFSIVRASRVDHESPAGVATDRYVAAAGDYNDIFVWSTDDFEQTRLTGHDGMVEELAVSADGKWLFSGSLDRTVRLWSLDDLTLVHTFRGFRDRISVLHPSRDGTSLYAGTYQRFYRIDLVGRGAPTMAGGHSDFVNEIIESVDGKRVFVAGSGVTVHDSTTLSELARWDAGGAEIVDADLTKNGAYLAVVGSDGSVSRFDTATGQRVVLRKPDALRALCVTLTADDTMAVAGFADGSVRAFGLAREPPVVARIHSDWVIDLATGPDGRIYSASRDRNIGAHTPGEGPRVITLAAHRAVVRRVIPSGKRLYTIGDDGDVYVWEGEDLHLKSRLRRKANKDVGEAGAVAGDPVGRLRIINGFRFPVELRAGGKKIVVHGGKQAALDGLPVPRANPCDDDSQCSAGQYCDYELDEPACASQTLVEVFAPGTEARLWAGYAVLDGERPITVRLPADEPFSVSQAAQAPVDPRTRLGAFFKAFPQPELRKAVKEVLGEYAEVSDTFLSPGIAEDINGRIPDDEAFSEVKHFLGSRSQNQLSPLALPMQPFRLRATEYYLMRPPHPPAKGSVLNGSLDTTMVIVSLYPASPEEARSRPFEIRAALEALIAEQKAQTGLEYHLIGGTIMDTWLETYARRDMEQLGPVFLLVVALLLGVVYRRISGVLVPLGSVLFAVIIAVGTAGWLGASFNNMTVSVPHVILASCIGDAVHIFNAYVDRVREGESQHEATINAIVANFFPCLWTTLSTAIGFFSLATSPIQPVKTFGWMAGIGVIMAFLISIIVLPTITSSLPAPKARKGSTKGGGFDAWIDERLRNLAAVVNRSTASILFFGVLVTVAAIWGSSKMTIDTNDLKFFAKEAPFRMSAEYVEEHITGSYSLQVMAELGEGGKIRQVEYLEELAALQRKIEESDRVMSVSTLTDTMMTMNRVMTHDLIDDYRLPENDGQASSYYDAYTLSLPSGLDLSNRVSSNESATVLDIRFKHGPASWFLAWGDELNRWSEENLKDVTIKITGLSWLYTNIAKDVAAGFLENVGSAVLLISILVFGLARSVRLGFPAAMANIVPILMTVGALSLAEVPLDISILVSCCVALGVVVDDTTHFLAKYRKQRDYGATHDEAVVETFREAGKAMVFTTVILVSGFTTLAFTDFAVNRNFGLVVSAMLTAGAVFDLTVLPAAIKLFGKDNA